MEILFLGTGGTQTIPKPCCNCELCQKARKEPKLQRNGPAIFLPEINVLFDTPMDISHSLTRENVKDVDAVFYTHYHPDHTAGAMVFEQICWFWPEFRARKTIDIYFPEGVIEDLEKYRMDGTINFNANVRKTIRIKRVGEKDILKIKDYSIRPVKISKDNVWGFLIEQQGKKIFYAPCDIELDVINEKLKNEKLDACILEMGVVNTSPEILKNLSKRGAHLFSDELMEAKKLKCKNFIFTHIEENRQLTPEIIKKLKTEDNTVDFAYDGMRLKL
jgi:phosphoribosyl 1,2-cyclic phosphate phosphodiesterase